MPLKMALGYVSTGLTERWAMAVVELWNDNHVRRFYLREWNGEGAYRNACKWATRCIDRYNRTARQMRGAK